MRHRGVEQLRGGREVTTQSSGSLRGGQEEREASTGRTTEREAKSTERLSNEREVRPIETEVY